MAKVPLPEREGGRQWKFKHSQFQIDLHGFLCKNPGVTFGKIVDFFFESDAHYKGQSRDKLKFSIRTRIETMYCRSIIDYEAFKAKRHHWALDEKGKRIL